MFARSLALILSGIVSGCAGPAKFQLPGEHPLEASQTLRSLCSAGTTSQGASATVSGAAWLKAESTEASGQFPAEILVKGKQVTMEVTNLLGGREALIRVDGDRVEIQRPGRPTELARDHWAGIPLKWSVDLLRGRPPCPTPSDAWTRSTRWVDAEMGILEFSESAKSGRPTVFRYRLTRIDGRIVASSVDVETGGASTHFEFSDYQSQDGTYRKFEAVSALGKVRLKWKHREFSPAHSES